MKQTGKLLIAGSIGALALAAQTLPMTTSFQQVGTLEAGGRGIITDSVIVSDGGVAGKPFSGTVTTQMKTTYSDGTNIQHTTTTAEYRDNDGRTRRELQGQDGTTNILIRDPIAGVIYSLDVASRTGVKYTMGIARRATGTPEPDAVRTTAPATGKIGKRAAGGGRGGFSNGIDPQVAAAARRPNTKVDDLGTMTVNGVVARGSRVTTIIPAGAIGNDREMRSVNESWFSPDLDMVIKSVATDPRFGMTTREVTNISRTNPDRSLFEPPSDYTISEPK